MEICPMFTCAKIYDGSSYLGSHLTANDYYCENEHITGVWIGKGAEQLHLAGNSIGKNDDAFEAVRRNLRPDGSGILTPFQKENGVRFFDFQCAPHKSISIMAVALDDQRLYAAHDNAAAKAFAELERFAAFRSGRTREPQITGNLCAAAFRHDASRALDPQLHTHFVVANATWNHNRKRWLALETCEMFKAIRYAGKFYQNELALQCRKLGYQIQSVRNEKGVVEGFEIKGVSPEIQERFSKRRAEVEAGIERFQKEKGRMPTASEIHTITRDTRNVKLKEITTAEVRDQQLSQLSAAEISALNEVKRSALAAVHENTGMGSAWKALMRASNHLFERHSVLPGHKVIAETLNQQLGYLDISALRRYMHSAYNGLVRLAEHVRNPLLSCQWSTQQGLNLERWSIDFVNQTQNSCSPLGKTGGIAFEFKSEEQANVVLETLQNTDQVYAIRGCAGAGKTTSLSEIRKGLEAAGRQVFYLAPTASAVKVLHKDGFARATTVDDFLTNQDKIKDLRNSIIIIDESSLQSSQMGGTILQVAQKNNARVLLVGDVRQHVSIEAGDFLRILEQHSNLNRSELKDIRRQKVDEYNAAIRTMAKGEAMAGMIQLDALGWIRESKGKYIQDATKAYLEATANGINLDRCIAISPTWEENHRFTDAIRGELKHRQLLSKGSIITTHDQLDWTDEQKRNAANYRPGMLLTFNSRYGNIDRGQTLPIQRIEKGQIWLQGHTHSINVAKCSRRIAVSLPRSIEICPGDKILIRRNHRNDGLVNGQVFTVQRLCPDGSIETREGPRVSKNFRHFCHGYVVTSHKAQGRTNDCVVIAAQQLDPKAAYVACSRGKQEATVFTPEKEHLFSYLRHSADRPAAMDIVESSRCNFWKQNGMTSRQHARTFHPKNFHSYSIEQTQSHEIEFE
jgi:conjugative relaxase-like TrwC/TraI family protein